MRKGNNTSLLTLNWSALIIIVHFDSRNRSETNLSLYFLPCDLTAGHFCHIVTLWLFTHSEDFLWGQNSLCQTNHLLVLFVFMEPQGNLLAIALLVCLPSFHRLSSLFTNIFLNEIQFSDKDQVLCTAFDWLSCQYSSFQRRKLAPCVSFPRKTRLACSRVSVCVCPATPF